MIQDTSRMAKLNHPHYEGVTMTESAKPISAVSIDVDGTTCLLDLGNDPLKGLYEAIHCSTVDVVRLAPDMHMWVDDEGMLKRDGVGINLVATVIADALGYGHQPYYGTAVFTGGADEEGETLPISPERSAMLTKWACKILEHRGELVDDSEEAGDDAPQYE